jgi:hypothetical protein
MTPIAVWPGKRKLSILRQSQEVTGEKRKEKEPGFVLCKVGVYGVDVSLQLK